jgi:HK97 family phage major capsid protein
MVAARLMAKARAASGGNMRDSLISQEAASAGTLVWPQWLGLLEPGLWRPLTIRQLLTVMPTTSDTIEYVREVSHVNNAAIVADATALSGSSGTKPQGGLIFEKITDTVKTIAEWVAVTRRIVKDSPQLMEYINQYLMNDIAQELEDQIMSGTGGDEFEGILEVVSQSVGPAGSGAWAAYNKLDLVRAAKRVVFRNGRTNATAVVVNPSDSEVLDILKASTAGTYFSGGPYMADTVTPLWGLTRIESEAVPEGTAVVGDFRRAILFDREDTSIVVGTAMDDLIRNLMRVLGEARYGFGVVRETAFCAIEF